MLWARRWGGKEAAPSSSKVKQQPFTDGCQQVGHSSTTAHTWMFSLDQITQAISLQLLRVLGGQSKLAQILWSQAQARGFHRQSTQKPAQAQIRK